MHVEYNFLHRNRRTKYTHIALKITLMNILTQNIYYAIIEKNEKAVTTMSLIYKYYSNTKYSHENLKNKKICFTPLETLNDPFEGVGKIQILDTNGKNLDLFNQSLERNVSKTLVEEYFNVANFKYRVFCATEEPFNAAMWSYYANNHTGFCVAYDKDELSSIDGTTWKAIDYLPEPYDLDKITIENFGNLVFQKSIDWQHEHEYRGVYTLSKEDVCSIKLAFPLCLDCNRFITMLNPQNVAEDMMSLKYIAKSCEPKAIYLGMYIKFMEIKPFLRCSQPLLRLWWRLI